VNAARSARTRAKSLRFKSQDQSEKLPKGNLPLHRRQPPSGGLNIGPENSFSGDPEWGELSVLLFGRLIAPKAGQFSSSFPDSFFKRIPKSFFRRDWGIS